jgi:hypothetical protein
MSTFKSCKVKLACFALFAATVFILIPTCAAQHDPKPEDATAAVLHAFEKHDIVIFGEIHGNKQEYEWLRSLIAAPEFADRVDDIVMEFGNSLYQKSVDRYIAGGDVSIEQVEKAWRNTVGAIGPPSPVSGWIYQAVRETNLRRRGKHQMRVLCGDPYIDWDNVKTRRRTTCDAGCLRGRRWSSHDDNWTRAGLWQQRLTDSTRSSEVERCS